MSYLILYFLVIYLWLIVHKFHHTNSFTFYLTFQRGNLECFILIRNYVANYLHYV